MALLNATMIRSCSWSFIVVYLVIYSYGILSGAGVLGNSTAAVGGDFRCFYAASYKLLSGDVVGIYNVKSLYAAEQQISGLTDINLIGWYYPPPFLLFVAWLATLPYLLSLFSWLAITLAGYVLVVRRIAPHPYTAGLILAFPGTFQNAIYGQNGFLSALLLGQGLLLLEQQPGLAGAILGLLVYKPQIAFLMVIALAAGRRWRALLAACTSAAVVIMVSIACYGIASWETFFGTLPLVQHYLATGTLPWSRMPTFFAQARLWGASVPLAYGVQALFTAAAVGAVVWVWRKPLLPLAYVVLTAGIFLATPYSFEYDLAIVGLGIAWYGWEGIKNGWLPYEKTVLVLAWFMPLLNSPIAYLTGMQIVPVILFLLLVLVLRRRYVLSEDCGRTGLTIQKPAKDVCAGFGGDD